MRRADRLFEIIQFMRRKDLVRARDLSEVLEVSERTIYRDIQDLIASGVPIEGEAGVGYVLKAGFDLPPLMFSEQEIEALVLGARIVRVLGRSGACRGRRRRDRQGRGGDPRAAARLHGQHRPAGAAAPLHGADQLRRGGVAAGAAQPAQGALQLPQRAGRGLASAPCGRCASPTSDRSGCCRPGASCARISAPSASTASRASQCQADRFRAEPGRTLHDFLKRDQTWTRGYGTRPDPAGANGAAANGSAGEV